MNSNVVNRFGRGMSDARHGLDVPDISKHWGMFCNHAYIKKWKLPCGKSCQLQLSILYPFLPRELLVWVILYWCRFKTVVMLF